MHSDDDKDDDDDGDDTMDLLSRALCTGMFLSLYLMHRADVLLDQHHVGKHLPTLPAWKFPSLAEQEKNVHFSGTYGGARFSAS